jgi:hypothetical protein
MANDTSRELNKSYSLFVLHVDKKYGMLKITNSCVQGTSPTCHDFGPPGCLKLDSPDVIPLLGMWGS